MNLNSIISAVLLASLSTQALAAGRFFLVVPVLQPGVNVDSINLSLQQAQLPDANLAEAYDFDMASVLSVTGDPDFYANGVNWKLVKDSLPAGLSLSRTGIISGVPAARSAGTPFVVEATYKTKTARRGYEIVVNGVPVSRIDMALADQNLPQAEILTAYSYDLRSALTVTGDPEYNPADVTWVATGIPAGLTLSPEGVLSGAPKNSNLAGAQFQVTATYKTRTGEKSYALVIKGVSEDKILMSLDAVTLPAAEVGEGYSYDLKQALKVTGDPEYTTAQVTWSATGLPAGISLSPTGVLSGTPTLTNSTGAAFNVKATYKTKAGTRDYTLVINSASLSKISVALAPQTLPQAEVSAAYSFDLKTALTVSGDPEFTPAKVSWAATGLPRGMTLSADGVLAGSPETSSLAGLDINVTATYRSKTGTHTYSLVINRTDPAKITVALAASILPAGEVSTAYSYDLKQALAVTGDPEYTSAQVTWSATGLPAGMTLSSAGVLSGTPLASQTASIPVTATYRTKAGTRTYSLVINRVDTSKIAVSLAAVSLPAGEVSTAYSYDLKQALSVTGDPEYSTAQVTWSASGLPSGMTLSSSGILSGTPSASQTASIPVTASYRTKAGSRTYSLVINGVNPSKISVSLAAASLPAGKVNTSYSYDFRGALSVSGDPEYNAGNVSWSASGLPAGLAMSGGVVSGTPTVAYSSGTNITVSANYKGKVGSQAYSLVIAQGFTASSFGIQTSYQQVRGPGYPPLAVAYATNNSGQTLTISSTWYSGAWAPGSQIKVAVIDLAGGTPPPNSMAYGTLSTGETLMLYWNGSSYSSLDPR